MNTLIFDTHGNAIRSIIGESSGTTSRHLRAAQGSRDDLGKVYMDSAGAIHRYTPSQLEARAVRPNITSVWNNDTMTWDDGRELGQVKVELLVKLKAAKSALIEAPKVTSVGTFDATQKAVTDLNTVIQLTKMAAERGLPATANFTLTSNERVTLTLAQLETAALEMGAQVQAVYDLYDPIINRVREAATLAELDMVPLP